MLKNLKNYFMFEEFAKNGTMVLHTSDITINNWQEYYDGILNMMRDGIETEFLQKSFITVDLGYGDIVEVSVMDLYFNIIHWYLIVRTGREITGKHLYFERAITQDNIKDFIDNHFIDEVRKEIDNVSLNNIIDDMLHNYIDVDRFSMFIANTINLEDDIKLMNASEEFNDLLHTKLDGMPIEDIKSIGMERTERAIDIIINKSKELLGYAHCLRDPFLAKEGINKRQYKEYAIHIGSKPNGQGGVHPAIIDGSYVQGALNTVLAQFIDSSSSRVAQIQMKKNVGDSGNFARILGINNIDTKLYDDPTYDCHSKNYEIIEVKNKRILDLLTDRYYRLHPKGQEFLIGRNDDFLVGRTIYLRSPMTCSSASRGNGICYKCYGDLSYTNTNIKVGKYAAENLSSELTQRQLSAKHLLETLVKKMRWCPEFYKYFSININILQISEEVEFPKGSYLIIDPGDADYKRNRKITDTDEEIPDDDTDEEVVKANYSNYVTEFYIEHKDGTRELIKTEDQDKMYITPELANIFHKKAKISEDDLLMLDLSYLAQNGIPLFYIKLTNNELSKTLDDIQNLLNKKQDTKSHNRHSILQQLFDKVLEGNLHIMAVHLEVLLMNQLRHAENILDNPDWDNPDEPYQIITLNQALIDNPSITISMLYQNLSKVLYYPLSYKKTKPSYMDLFFMKQPQNFLSDTSNIVDENPKKDELLPIVVRHRVKDKK